MLNHLQMGCDNNYFNIDLGIESDSVYATIKIVEYIHFYTFYNINKFINTHLYSIPYNCDPYGVRDAILLVIVPIVLHHAKNASIPTCMYVQGFEAEALLQMKKGDTKLFIRR